ncbi:MAG: hypothetical protein FIB08_06465 [Candidatus Methanoperedens sp.]|nr:hypothetical protein [Candidatus Methanoperedens sp.]
MADKILMISRQVLRTTWSKNAIEENVNEDVILRNQSDLNNMRNNAPSIFIAFRIDRASRR